MYCEDDRAQLAVTDLLVKVGSYWNPEHLEVQNPLRPVRDIVYGAELTMADVAYLQTEAPSVLIQADDSKVYIDYSMLTETRSIRPRDHHSEFNVQVLRAWHLLLLRSTFWPRYHRVYEQVGSLAEVNHHADALWSMIDPLAETQNQPLIAQDAPIRNVVVFRQILATRSELSDLHPIDALARLCIPGYVERVHEYVQRHAEGVSQMLGLTV